MSIEVKINGVKIDGNAARAVRNAVATAAGAARARSEQWRQILKLFDTRYRPAISIDADDESADDSDEPAEPEKTWTDDGAPVDSAEPAK